jgi:peptidoglycan/xylan/chitin deacetylase (PgdA/CDA1 family)
MIRWLSRATHPREPGPRVPREMPDFLIGLAILALAIGLTGVALLSSRGRAIGGVAAAGCMRGQVALTFDGGPGTHTAQILSVLRSHGVRATFFVTGSNASANPALIRAETAGGNEVQNNTWDHAALGLLTVARSRAEIVRTQRAIVAAGAAAPTAIRLPYGSTNQQVQDLVSVFGLEIMQYSIDTGDLQGRLPWQITATVLRQATNGSVVLMHDGLPQSANTLAALPGIIDGLRSAGFCMALASAVPDIRPRAGQAGA